MTTEAELVRASAYYRARTAAVRALRRIPGIRAAARAVMADELGGMRSRAAVREMAAPLDIRPGRFFAEQKGRTLPVVVFVATSIAAGDGEKLAAAVEQAQYLTGSFRPLFVIDAGQFGPFRARGFAVEYVMAREAYLRVNPADSYPEYLLARVSSIARAYRAASVVPLRPDALPDSVQLRLVGAQTRRPLAHSGS